MTIDLCWCLTCFKFLKNVGITTESMLLKNKCIKGEEGKIFDFPVLSNFLRTNALLTFDYLVPSCRSCLSRGEPRRSKTIIWTFTLQWQGIYVFIWFDFRFKNNWKHTFLSIVLRENHKWTGVHLLYLVPGNWILRSMFRTATCTGSGKKIRVFPQVCCLMVGLGREGKGRWHGKPAGFYAEVLL